MRPTFSSTPSVRSMSRTVERASTMRKAMPRLSSSAFSVRNVCAPAMSIIGEVVRSQMTSRTGSGAASSRASTVSKTCSALK